MDCKSPEYIHIKNLQNNEKGQEPRWAHIELKMYENRGNCSFSPLYVKCQMLDTSMKYFMAQFLLLLGRIT